LTLLPRIMVAPNGARRGRADHPALPVTIPQIVAEAQACFAAGSGGIHAHVRDAQGAHSLDVGLYRELLEELARAVPQMAVQITTEAVGRYSPAEQKAVVKALMPDQVSIAMREITKDEPEAELTRFFHDLAEAGVGVQHILYAPQEVTRMEALVAKGIIPSEGLELMLVLGQYGGADDSRPEDLAAYLDAKTGALTGAGWAVCAFGRHETACLVQAVSQGGKARIGFENNLLNADGHIAASNAERVAELCDRLRSQRLIE
jgi:3-keto-5-aminohexanoate cleavage enzyme